MAGKKGSETGAKTRSLRGRNRFSPPPALPRPTFMTSRQCLPPRHTLTGSYSTPKCTPATRPRHHGMASGPGILTTPHAATTTDHQPATPTNPPVAPAHGAIRTLPGSRVWSFKGS